MKGMLVKDIKLMLRNVKIYIIMMACALLVLLKSDNYSFIMGYIIMLNMIFVFNTLSFDESNKGMTFLMTLPMKRETYATEKYVLMLVFGFIGTVVGAVASIARFREMALAILTEAAAVFIIGAFIVFIMLPLQLKFSSEKGRMIAMGGIACIVCLTPSFGVIGEVADRIISSHTAAAGILEHIIIVFRSLNSWVIGGMAFLIWLICLAVSITVSWKIMRGKEF